MAITALAPTLNAEILPGASFAFTIDDTYTSLVIKVQTATSLVNAYSTALGGGQSGYSVAVVDNGDGTHTVTTSADSGWDVSPQLIYVVEDETGTEATTNLSYDIIGEASFPKGELPYNPVTETTTGPLNNYSASVAPGVTDDADAGYTAGSAWVDIVADKSYRLSDPTAGAAVWIDTSASAASGDVVGPASATDDAIAVYDGTTGKLLKDSTGTIAQIAANTAKNSYPSADSTKLAGIETGATADQDDTEVLLNGIIGSPTYTTIKEAVDGFHSSGVFTGGGVTDDGDGTITVAAGTGMIRATNSDVAPLLSFDWGAESGAAVNLSTNSMNYIYIEYNGGTPQVIATTTKRTDNNTNIELATVYRYTGSDIHITDNAFVVADHASKMILRLEEVHGLTHETGSAVSETGTRNIAITAGTWWIGLDRSNTTAIDTSVSDTFFYYYSDGAGGFTEVASSTAINNTQYDDGSGSLATLTNNQYGVHFVYMAQDGDVYVVYGTDSYTLAGAAEAPAPSSVPPHFAEHHAHIIARITIQKSASTFTEIDSAFEQLFNASGVADHGGLAGLGDDDHNTGLGAYAQTINGAGAPGVSTGDGYRLGTVYADTTNDALYVLVDATVGANVWASGGGSGFADAPDGALFTERADHVNTPSAGLHELWVKNDAEGTLIFTDDTAQDRKVVTNVSPQADAIVFGDNATTGQVQQDSQFGYSSGLLYSNSSTTALRQRERASAAASSATFGYWWTKSDAPTVPMFTDDTGTDVKLLPTFVHHEAGVFNASLGTTVWVGPPNASLWNTGSRSQSFGTGTDPTAQPYEVGMAVPVDCKVRRLECWYRPNTTTVQGEIAWYRHRWTSGSSTVASVLVGSCTVASGGAGTNTYDASIDVDIDLLQGDRLGCYYRSAGSPTGGDTCYFTSTVMMERQG